MLLECGFEDEETSKARKKVAVVVSSSVFLNQSNVVVSVMSFVFCTQRILMK